MSVSKKVPHLSADPIQPCADCGRPDPAAKPPPIRVGVEGFEGTLFSEAAPVPPIDPYRLASLPTFELFAAERGVNPKEAVFEPGLLADYERWHAEKGLWLLETPWGELKEGE